MHRGEGGLVAQGLKAYAMIGLVIADERKESRPLDRPTDTPYIHPRDPVHSQESSAASPIRAPGREFALLHAPFSMHTGQPV